jgi:iron complex outermembrane recepter protein
LAGLFDIERVEVLRGPQGTLYGRNATGGSINVITAKPSRDFEGFGRLTLGTYGTVIAEGAVSGSLVDDTILGRLAFKTSDHDGYGRNLVTGNDIDNLKERSVRGQLQFLFSDRFDVLVAADYTEGDDRSGVYHFAGRSALGAPPIGVVYGGFVAQNIRDIAGRRDPQSRRRFWGASGTATYRVTDDIAVKSITAFRRTIYHLTNTSLDPSSLSLFPVQQREAADQFSQELQLTGSSRLIDWVAGLYYFRESNDAIVGGPVSAGLLGANPNVFLRGYFGGTNLTTNAYAAFGQVKYRFGSGFAATIGMRYSSEKKSVLDQAAFDLANPAPSNAAADLALLAPPQATCGVGVPSIPGCQPSRRWTAFTPKITLEYELPGSVLAYAGYSRGFKSGTYNLGSVQGTPVDPEDVDAYEAGLKATFLGGAVRANLASFYYKYKNLQVSKVVLTQLRLENAATATIKGIELELTARPTEGLRIDASAAFLDAKFDSFVSVDPTRPAGDGITTDSTNAAAFNLAGKTLPQSPKFSGRLGLDYTVPIGAGELSLRGDVTHASRAFFTAFNLDQVSRSEMTQLGAGVSYLFGDRKTRLSVTGRNLTDQTRVTNAFVATVFTGAPQLGFLNEPRVVTISIERRF